LGKCAEKQVADACQLQQNSKVLFTFLPVLARALQELLSAVHAAA
jgi:hypothetical protein